MNLGLKGKTALVTGGSRGVGRAVALALAQEGCNVAILARGQADLGRTEGELRSVGVRAMALYCDVQKEEDIIHAFDHICAAFAARIDILVNNVGGGGRWGPDHWDGLWGNQSAGVWEQVWAINMGAVVAFTSRVLGHMYEAGWGRVVTISSIQGRESGGRPWHAAAKAAEIAFIKSMSKDMGLVRAGITFNTVAPGALLIPDTGWDALRLKHPGEFQAKCDSLPLGRLGTPEEVAVAVAFLCSDQARYINGACLVADGGEGRAF